jgi:ribosomal small subunit protein bTHX
MASLSSLQQRFLLALHPYVCACRTLSSSSPCLGKGDQRTKRGKIARGTFGMLLIPLISF